MVTLNTDGITPVLVKADAASHSMVVDDHATGSGLPYVNAERDNNHIPVGWAVSSADGKTPVPIYGFSDGSLLINSS